MPKLNAKESNNNSTSTRFLTSTSYLSLQNISVGYTLPKNWIAKLGCESLRVYFVADNVALLSARKGYDPRTNWNGESNYNYSALRSISGGITMKFLIDKTRKHEKNFKIYGFCSHGRIV